MENMDEQFPERNLEDIPPSANDAVVYPPKYEKKDQTTNIWIKSVISLGLYLFLGYHIFHSFQMLLLITGVVLFHELGHFFAMKFFRYKDLGIFFIPLLGAYVSGSKREVSQKESAIILLAGPLPGIILGIIFYLLYQNDPSLSIGDISFGDVALLLVFLNLINLFPVYPLDGGQLLNRVFLDEEGWIGKAFVFISIGLLVWFSWRLYSYHNNQPIYLIFLFFPLMMLLRMFGDNKLRSVEKKIETEGIDMDKSYEDLPAEDYWKIRNILIEQHPAFSDVPPAPPYEYDGKEEKIMTTIQSLLHRHLVEDVSVVGKIFILLIWVAAIASPWLLNMNMYFFRQFGF
jgi:stage IV sporulation protein FB